MMRPDRRGGNSNGKNGNTNDESTFALDGEEMWLQGLRELQNEGRGTGSDDENQESEYDEEWELALAAVASEEENNNSDKENSSTLNRNAARSIAKGMPA